MKHFTPQDIKPSETTLSIIRQIAYTYRVAKTAGAKGNVYCLN